MALDSNKILVATDAALNNYFARGFGETPQYWDLIADLVPSTGASEVYPWFDEWPSLRKWVGDRQVKEVREHHYTLVNEDWKGTVKIKRNELLDRKGHNRIPTARGMGRAVAKHPDEQIHKLLEMGVKGEAIAYDKQPLFSEDHKGFDDKPYSNFLDAGEGEPWFLLVTTGLIKPLIFQRRQAPQFVALMNVRDPNVFFNKEFLWGVDYRAGFGVTFPQLAFASTAPLTAENLELAEQVIANMVDNNGQRLGLRPDTLVAGVSNWSKARTLLLSKQIEGSDNPWHRRFRVIESNWLN